MTIYLDNQASSPLDPSVAEQMANYSALSYGNPHSADHAIGWSANSVVEAARQRVAALVGSDTNEIVFTSGATESNNIAILGLRRPVSISPNVIIRSAIEHKSVITAFDHLESDYGFTVRVAPVDSIGKIQLEELEAILRDGSALCSIGAVNSEIGTIQDVLQIGRLCRRYGAIFHCDAAQASAAIDISDLALHADLISLSAHKMYGPMGVGALFVSHEVRGRIKPIMFGGGQQDGIRPGTLPVPLCLGIGSAAALAVGDSGERSRNAVREVRDRFVNRVLDADADAALNGSPLHDRHPGNANLRFCGVDALELLGTLQPKLAAASGSACTSGSTEPSYVLRAIGLDIEAATESLRFSFGKQNTIDEADRAAELVVESAKRVRQHGG